jgi:hypothetical protein
MSITLNGTTGVTTTGLTSNGIDDNATSTAITIDASENVGIGTLPDRKLHVHNTNGAAAKFGGTGGGSDFAIEIGQLDSSNGAAGFNAVAGAMKFQMAGTEAMRITAAGSVGINTTSSDSYYAKKLVVDCGTDGQNGITIKSSTTGAGMFAFADGTSGSDRYRGYINYNHANDSMTLGTAGGAGILGIDATGAVTMPHQPAFSVNPSGTQADIAPNGVRVVAFGTERFDIGSNFASNTFTAPVTGKYQLNVEVRLDNMDTGATYYHLYLLTSNKTYHSIMVPRFTSDPAYMSLSTSVLADMDENDVAYVGIYQASGTQQTDISGDSNFSGYLVA